MPLTSRNEHQYALPDRPAVSQKRHQELSIMTHKPADIQGQQAPALRPTTYNEASGYDWDIVKAQARYEELTDRDLYARSRATLEARGEYDPARHGTAVPEPLTVGEHLELLANGEALARHCRHPSILHHAVKAGASWEQIGAARGASAEQARQDYREWAKGQHDLWTGKWGGEPGRSGLNSDAAAIARAAEGQLGRTAGPPAQPARP